MTTWTAIIGGLQLEIAVVRETRAPVGLDIAYALNTAPVTLLFSSISSLICPRYFLFFSLAAAANILKKNQRNDGPTTAMLCPI